MPSKKLFSILLSTIFFSNLLIPCSVIYAQTLMNKDSLLQQLAVAKEDTNKVWLYIKLSKAIQASDMPKAHLYSEEAYGLSEKLHFDKGKFKAILRKTGLFRASGNVDSVFECNKRFLALAKQMKDTLNIAVGFINIAESYNDLGDAEKAIEFSLQGLAVIERVGAPELKQDAYDNLQRIYFTRSEYGKSIEYGTKSVQIARALNVPQRIASALFNLSVAYNNNKEFDKAIAAANEVVSISRANGDDRVVAYGLSNLCDINIKLRNIPAALNYELESYALAKKVQDRDMEATTLTGLAMCYLQQKDYTKAQDFATQAAKLHDELGNMNGKVSATKVLADIAFATGDPQKGYAYELFCDDYEQKHINQVLSKQSSDLEKKYETEKKETQIKKLEAEKTVQQLTIRQKIILNYILIGSAVTLLLISLLGYRTYKQKQKLQQQRIAELETQQQLTATEAVLKGEEQERTRLAKDLHDGLGGMLSGIKYSFNTMRGNLVMTPDNAQAFERSMDMLDSSIKEMRRVAHNMMPEALVKFGLDTALKDFCTDINNSGALQVSYQSIGLENVMIDQTVAITIYRIVQELINNTMKHAAAKTALVQVSKTNNQLTVTVEDDGRGFDTAILNRSVGIGWSNIQNRVEFLKGNLDVQSGKEKGTSVHIEINNL
jgi:two-component system, NarL family, sensor kinase